MNISKIANVASRVGGRNLLRVQKYAPQILTGVGILGSVTSTVLAVKATTKLDVVLEGHEKRVQEVKNIHADFATSEATISTTNLNRALTKEYAKTGLKLTKLYGPAIGVGVLGYTSIICGHGMMIKRQTALLAAYATVERTLSEYRKRVQDAIGDEKELELYHDVQFEKGKDAQGKDALGIKERPLNASGYARFFDQLSNRWSNDPEQNLTYLTMQQNYFNDKLQRVGHVFLNDVYETLGIPKTKAGQCVGWVYQGDGDNYIDFGLFRNDQQVRQFVNGREVSILLDFNVDGPILDIFAGLRDDPDEHAGFLSRHR